MFRKILNFFQLADRAGNLSISNIAVIVLITKIALAATIDWGVVSGLLITLLNYGHKRHESNKAAKDTAVAAATSALQEQVSQLAGKLESIQDASDKQAELNEVMQKQADEVKKIVANAKLVEAFAPRRGGQ